MSNKDILEQMNRRFEEEKKEYDRRFEAERAERAALNRRIDEERAALNRRIDEERAANDKKWKDHIDSMEKWRVLTHLGAFSVGYGVKHFQTVLKAGPPK